jgi:predicted O-linked N-acetylglucosamine transferase (SPINDLY family)
MLPSPVKRPNHLLIGKPLVSFTLGDFSDSQLQLGSDLHKSGNLTEARVIYEKYLSMDPDRYEALHLLGTLEAQSGNFEKSIDLLYLAIEKNPYQWDSYSNLGNVFIETKDFHKAIDVYNNSIELNPNNANDFCHRAFALYRTNQMQEALNSIESALKLKPNYVLALLHCGNIQLSLGQIDNSINTFKKAINYQPDNPICHLSYGAALVADSKIPDALECFDKAISLKYDYAEAHLCRGDSLVSLGQKQEALLSYRNSIKFNHERPEAHFNLAITLADFNQLEEAVRGMENALLLDPHFAEAYAAIGILYGKLGRLCEGITSLSKAIDIKPTECSFYLNRGNIYAELRRFEESFADYDKCIEIKPDYHFAFCNKGHVLLSYLNSPDTALIYFDVAISLQPKFVTALINRGEAFNRLGQLDKALDSFLRALEIEPEAPYVIGKCLHYKMKICDWSNFEEGIEIYESMLSNNIPAAVPFEALNFTDNPELHLKAAKLNLAEKFNESKILGDFPARPENDIIKIGYYSADLYYHPVAIWLVEQLENHDKSKVELYAFCLKSVKDPMRDRLEAAFDHWIDVQGMSDLEIAKLSRELAIDIAIDLNGHTGDGRPGVFAARAARVQLNHLGFPSSMGAEYIDYVIGQTPRNFENIDVVPEDRQYITEKIAYVPSAFTYDRQRQLSNEPQNREQFGLPENVFVFTCQNGCQKLTPEVFDVWMEILNAVPNSVLWLLKPNQIAVNNLCKEAHARGVDEKRLIFTAREHVPMDQEKARIGRYLASYKLADLFLDTWPYNAGTTAIDALWSGLPVLTKQGRSTVSGMAAGALREIEVPELITQTPKAYLDLAIDLASHPHKLKQIKEKLQRNKLTTSLFDPVNNTRHIENAYIQMHQRCQAGLPPADFVVKS